MLRLWRYRKLRHSATISKTRSKMLGYS